MRSGLYVLILCAALQFAGCETAPANVEPQDYAHYVEAGTVTAHGVWAIKKALAQAGIPAYTDGSEYPQYRILVPPAYRGQAVDVLKQIQQQPQSIGYGITHE